MLIDLKKRELAWIVDQSYDVCAEICQGLEECYALLSPDAPGSTLVVTTPGLEKVKGTMTRVGTRIVKGVSCTPNPPPRCVCTDAPLQSINLQLQTQPPQSLSVAPNQALQIHPLDALDSHLSDCIHILSVILPQSCGRHPTYLATVLTQVDRCLAASAGILKGPAPMLHDPSWQTWSCPPERFSPPLQPNLSFHIGIRDCSISLYLRALEPVHAPVHLGTRLGLAIGTVRRLEHDEMDAVFNWKPDGSEMDPSKLSSHRRRADPQPVRGGDDQDHLQHNVPPRPEWEEVYVREKVHVESADPCLISLYSKVTFLAHKLGQTRRNLAAAMGEELPD